MIRELLGIDCSEEEERIAAACIILRADSEEIALDPALRTGVTLALCALEELPPAWRREMALETLAIETVAMGIPTHESSAIQPWQHSN